MHLLQGQNYSSKKKCNVHNGCASDKIHLPRGGAKHNMPMDAVIFLYPCIFKGILLFRGYFLQSTAKEDGLGHTYIWAKSGLPGATFLLLFLHARQSSTGNRSLHRQSLGPWASFQGTEETSSMQTVSTGAGGPLFPGAWSVCVVHSNWKPSHAAQQVGTAVLQSSWERAHTRNYFQHIFTHLYETQLTPWSSSQYALPLEANPREPQGEGPAPRVFPALCWPQTRRAAPRNPPCHQCSPPKAAVLFFLWSSLKLFETHFLNESPKEIWSR